jgi:hypothetical protein
MGASLRLSPPCYQPGEERQRLGGPHQPLLRSGEHLPQEATPLRQPGGELTPGVVLHVHGPVEQRLRSQHRIAELMADDVVADHEQVHAAVRTGIAPYV